MASLARPETSLKVIWDHLDNEPAEVAPVVTVVLKPKLRLESFETTDVPWPTPAALLNVTEEKLELTGDESAEEVASGKGAVRKEARRLPAKTADKIRNKIRKLRGFWGDKPRMMPHIFKLLVREDHEVFELHDLSLKGANGGKGEAAEGRDLEADDQEGDEPDVLKASPLDCGRTSSGLR